MANRVEGNRCRNLVFFASLLVTLAHASGVQAQQDSVPNLPKLADSVDVLNRQQGQGAAFQYTKGQFDLLERTLTRRIETIARERRRISATRSSATSFTAGVDLAQLGNPTQYPQFTELSNQMKGLLAPTSERSFERRTGIVSTLLETLGKSFGGPLVTVARARLSGLIDGFGETVAQAFDFFPKDQRRNYWVGTLRRPLNTFTDERWNAYADSAHTTAVSFLEFIQQQNDSTYTMGERITSIENDADNAALNLDTELAEIGRFADVPVPAGENFNRSPDQIKAAVHTKFSRALGNGATFREITDAQLDLLSRGQILALSQHRFTAEAFDLHQRMLAVFQAVRARATAVPERTPEAAKGAYQRLAATLAQSVDKARSAYVDNYEQTSGVQ